MASWGPLAFALNQWGVSEVAQAFMRATGRLGLWLQLWRGGTVANNLCYLPALGPSPLLLGQAK